MQLFHETFKICFLVLKFVKTEYRYHGETSENAVIKTRWYEHSQGATWKQQKASLWCYFVPGIEKGLYYEGKIRSVGVVVLITALFSQKDDTQTSSKNANN